MVNYADNVTAPPPLRAIVGARTSVFTDEKVSHDAQREAGTAYATTNAMLVVGYFEDLGVSATVTPWERPDLGPWLSDERKNEFDVIIWSKVDRAFRSSKDCADVAYWAEQNRKRLVFTDDGIVLDYRESADSFGGMMAKFFLTIASLFGEMELRRFRMRALDAHRELKTRDRWASGVPPLGFRIVDHPSGHGKTLARDDYGYDLLHEMANKLLDGWSFTAIAHNLNESGAVTNVGRSRQEKTAKDGKARRNPKWQVTDIKRALTTLRTQGVKMSGDDPVLDADGEYVTLGEPTFDADMWDELQVRAGERAASGKRRAISTNPLLHVGYCGECGASLTRRSNNGHTYYRCGRTPVACKGVSIRDERAEWIVENEIQETFGDLYASRQVFVPGTDNSRELAKIGDTIARLRRESDAGLITTAQDEEEYLARMRALIGRRDELAVSPQRFSGWTTEFDSITYREKWTAGNVEQRRQIARNARIRLYVFVSGRPPQVEIPLDLAKRLNVTEMPLTAYTKGRAPSGMRADVHTVCADDGTWYYERAVVSNAA